MSDEISQVRHPGGRPTKYKSEYCEMLQEHMAKGLSYEVFGAKIGVSRQTLYDWEKEYPEFLDTKKYAFDLCQLFWEEKCIEHIVTLSENERDGQYSKSTTKALNTGAWIFNMKNRFKWTDKTSGEDLEDSPIKLAYDPKTIGDK